MCSVMNTSKESPHSSESPWGPEGSAGSGNQRFELLWQQRSTQTSQGSFTFERWPRKASSSRLVVESPSETHCRPREGAVCPSVPVPAPPSCSQLPLPGVRTSPHQGGRRSTVCPPASTAVRIWHLVGIFLIHIQLLKRSSKGKTQQIQLYEDEMYF